MVVLNSGVERDELLARGCVEKINRVGTEYFDKQGKVLAKKCTKCFKLKRIKEFNKSTRGLGGRISRCTTCKSEYTKSWRKGNSERVAEYNVERKEERYETTRIWRINNQEKVREGKREWALVNKDKRILSDQKRMALKMKLPNYMTHVEYRGVGKLFRNSCALSGEPTNIHADHVIPLATGHGGTILGNMIPLSASLNTSKSDAHLFEWFELNRERFGLSQRKFDALIEYLAQANEMTTQEYRAYVDWCFDNPRVICETTGELVFKDGAINERGTQS